MSRPSAPVLAEAAIGSTFYKLVVKSTPGIWVLTYKGQLFNLVKEPILLPTSKKYQRTAWPNEAPARNWARRLNRYFDCEDFGVKCLM